MAAIKLTVGAALGANTDAIFAPLAESAKKAQKQIQDALGRGVGNSVKSAAAKSADEMERAADRAARAWERQLKSVASSAASTFRQLAGVVTSTLGGVVRGMGVNFDVSSNVSRAIASQRSAVLLANKGYQEGAEGAAGVRQDPGAILRDSAAAADATAHSIGEMNDALAGYVNKSGDLEGGRKMLVDIGKIANATGADLEATARAAGTLDYMLAQSGVSNVDERGKMVNSTMRNLSAQGKAGQQDIEEIAPQIPKLAAAANSVGMSFDRAMQTAGIMTQLAGPGGAGTAAQAAQSTVALIRDLRKGGKTEMALESHGISVFTDKNKTALRNPLEIMAEAIKQTHGNLPALAGMFRTSQGYRAVAGLANTYNKAGGGDAGVAAMKKQVDTLEKVTLSQKVLDEQNKKITETNASKAIKFQNQLEQIAGGLADKVMPALEAFAPRVLQAANALSGIVSWAANNPFEAVVGALTVSMGKALVGNALSNALSGAIRGAFGATGGAQGAAQTAASGAMGTIGKGFIIAAAAITVAEVGMLAIDKVAKMGEEADARHDAKQVDTENILRAGRMAASDARAGSRVSNKAELTEDQAKAVPAKIQELQDRIQAAKDPTGFMGAMVGSLVGGKGFAARGNEQRDAADLAALKAQLDGLKSVMEALKNGTLKVHVTNQVVPPPSVADGATDGHAPAHH